MNVAIRPDLQDFVRRNLAPGVCDTPDDFVNLVLDGYMQRETFERLSPKEWDEMFPGLREKIAEGIAAADAGDVSDGEEFFAELEAELAAEAESTV